MRSRRARVMDPFGTTEEYNARLERWNNPDYDAKYQKARYEKTKYSDLFIESLYAQYRELNKLPENYDDPYEVDHIRPLSRGGEHRFENLRLLKASKNCDDPGRTEEYIERITLMMAVLRRNGG